MGGPRITPEVANLVKATWLEMKRTGLEPTAKEVSETVTKKLQESGKNYLHAPGVRKTQDILKQSRKTLESRPIERKELDGPWTIGTTIKYPISSEAMLSVLRVWKLCVAAGVPFTIREAKWVAQLHTLITDIVELRDVAYQYALKEQTFEASEPIGTFETHDLDGRIAMDLWEYATARQVGEMGSSSLFFENWVLRPESLQMQAGDGKKAMQFAIRIAGLKRGLEGETPVEMSNVESMKTLRDEALKYPDFELPDNAAWIFAYWLTYISKGPKWLELSLSEIMDVYIRLREWVQASLAIETQGPGQLLTWLVESPKKDLTDYLLKPELRPNELLKKVGYEI